MNSENHYEAILSQMHQPAFLVHNGVITAVNASATSRFAQVDTPIDELITTGKEEYSELTQGQLILTISLCGTEYPCTVTCLEDMRLFTIETDAVQAELQVLALAAQQLSFPVSELTLLLNQLPDVEKKAQITQNLYRLKRIIGNMSDASRSAIPNKSQGDVCAVFDEMLEKAQALLAGSGITLTYKLPNQPIYSLIHQEILGRAVYNLLSNAAKFSNGSKKVDAELKQKGNKLYFTVSSKGSSAGGNLFHRYTRQPGLEERKFGLGLGMSLVHQAAVAHNGTVLIEQDSGQLFRVTVTLSITKGKGNAVRSPMLFPDVYGGNDQALIELSDVLSSELYL